MLQRPCQFRAWLQHGGMAGAIHDAGVVPVEERPIGAVDPDDLVRFNAVPEAQPPLLRQDRGRAAAHAGRRDRRRVRTRSEEHTSELQSIMSISYAVFCLKKKNEFISVLSTH